MHRRALIGTFALALAAGLAGVSQAQMPAPSTDPAAAPAGEYVLDPNHASVIARIKHLGLSNFAIRFDTVSGSFTFDPKNPTASKVTATVDAASYDVGNQKYQDITLNEHFIHQRDVLGNSKNPKVTFVSTSIKRGAGNHGTMTGDLTLNGITKPVTFEVTFNGTMPGMGGGAQRMGFSAMGVVHRSDFDIFTKAPMAMPAPVLSEEVGLQIEAEFTKKS
jgi:polyisoprenoid-binding protein YceI